MASITRSNRRAEGLHLYDRNVNASPLTRPAPGPNSFHHGAAAAAAGGRTKRALDVTERELDALKSKRPRIAVEILAKPQLPREPVNVQPPIPRRAAVASSAPRPPVAPVPPTRPAASTATTSTPAPISAAAADPEPPNASLTKHQAKVINGIRHELDRLQPRPDDTKDTKEQGRKLRSQEATRFKSELSAYFPDYDEVIGNDPKEQHLLNPDTPIIIIDTSLSRAIPDAQRTGPRPHHQQTLSGADFPIRGYGDALFTDVFDAQRIDFGFLDAQHKNKNIEDPLPDSLFEPIHKKAERVERSIRNTEKGRAQHEKDQIIRLLEGLQGHDWLRVMGVSGVTESKKKKFEPARMHFIKGCQAILAKFRNWNLEEKRRKLEKEKALAEKAEQEDESDNSDAESQEREDSRSRESDESEDEEDEAEDEAEEDEPSQDDASETSSPAKQLRREARARSKLAAANSKRSRPAHKPAPPTKPPEPPREFKSFFAKRYERESALNRQRRAGRKILAWGHPIPDIAEADFILPEEYRDEETLKARERKKRRDRRELRTLK
ncbi:something about silencing, SAS, complex subunit 4 domain-containing protein [Trichoderma aethiopicum]